MEDRQSFITASINELDSVSYLLVWRKTHPAKWLSTLSTKDTSQLFELGQIVFLLERFSPHHSPQFNGTNLRVHLGFSESTFDTKGGQDGSPEAPDPWPATCSAGAGSQRLERARKSTRCPRNALGRQFFRELALRLLTATQREMRPNSLLLFLLSL